MAGRPCRRAERRDRAASVDGLVATDEIVSFEGAPRPENIADGPASRDHATRGAPTTRRKETDFGETQMPAFWIALVRVQDEEAYGEYAKRAGPAIERHGGEFLARGGRYKSFEGDDCPRMVVVRFPSLEDAAACYESEEYQAAKALQEGAALRHLGVVEGVGVPPLEWSNA